MRQVASVWPRVGSRVRIGGKIFNVEEFIADREELCQGCYFFEEDVSLGASILEAVSYCRGFSQYTCHREPRIIFTDAGIN